MKASRVLTTGLLAMMAAPVTAAPPPPASLPDGVPATLEGYDMAEYVDLYVTWLDDQKSKTIRDILEPAPFFPGYTPDEPVIVAKDFSDDVGQMAQNEIRQYCRNQRSDCFFLFRRVELSEQTTRWRWYGSDGVIKPFVAKTFDAEKVVVRLKALGIPTSANRWSIDGAKIFSTFTDAATLHKLGIKEKALDSRTCPKLSNKMSDFLSEKDKMIDSYFESEAAKEAYLIPPHANYRINFITFSSKSGLVTFQGRPGVFIKRLASVWDTVDSCYLPPPAKDKDAN